MDVNNMIAAMAAKTVDAMVNVEPYNAIAEAEGHRHHRSWTSRRSTRCRCSWRRRPTSSRRTRTPIVAYLKAGSRWRATSRTTRSKVTDVIYAFFTSKGYSMSRDTFAKALARVEVDPGFPTDLVPYMQRDAEVLLREKKISAIPDWKKALRPDFMGQGQRVAPRLSSPRIRSDTRGRRMRAGLCAFGASPRRAETR